MMSRDMLTYILPVRSATPMDGDLVAYLCGLVRHAQTIVVDGSPPEVFALHGVALAGAMSAGLLHVPPSPELATEMGKVGGVLTGRGAFDQRIARSAEVFRPPRAA